jgi:hypothetical protein
MRQIIEKKKKEKQKEKEKRKKALRVSTNKR